MESHETEISALSSRIIELIKDEPGDAALKSAALRAAAEVMNQTMLLQVTLVTIHNNLRR